MTRNPLGELSVPGLTALAALLETYAPELPPAHRIKEIAGNQSQAVTSALAEMREAGRDMHQVAEMCRFGADTAARAADTGLVDLVLSGAQTDGVPTRDTAAVVQSLLVAAQSDITIAGYAFYDGRAMFESLAARMSSNPELRVRLLIDVRRKQNDTSLPEQVIERNLREFWRRQWPWTTRPSLYFDPRALEEEAARRAAMHAKFVLVDGTTALITSANFTPAAHARNVEVGVLIDNPLVVKRLVAFVDVLCAKVLRRG